jgi:PAS domain S-box-containing protein
MKHSLYRIITIPFFIIFLGIMALAFIARQNNRALSDTAKQIEGSNHILANTAVIEARDDENETALQSYMLTGDSGFIERYTEDKNIIAEHVEQLKLLTSGGQLQKQIDSLASAIQQKNLLFDSVLSLKEHGKVKAANFCLNATEEMDLVGRSVARIEQLQRNYLQQEKERSGAINNGLNRIYWIFIIIPLSLLIISAFAIAKSFSERKKKESEINRLNEVLEHRVKDRTAQLAKSEEKYRYIFEKNPMCMWVADKETLAFLDVNEATIKHFGYSYNEFLNMTGFDIRPWEEKERLAKNKLTDDLNPCNEGIWKLLKKDGTTIDAEIAAKELNFEGKEALLVFANDVTEKRIAEEKLASTNRELNQIFNTVDEGLFSMNVLTNKYIHVSSACEKIYGYPLHEFYANGNLWFEVIHPDDKPILTRNEAAIKKGARANMEYRIIHKDQSIRWLKAYIIPTLDANGNMVQVDGIVSDITENKKAEFEIKTLNESLEKRVEQRTVELAQANKELESFSYTASHDLRAPLRIINGYAKLLMQSEKELKKDSLDLLDVITKTSMSMAQLIDDLLNFSKVGGRALQKHNVNMTEEAKAVVTEIKQSLNGHCNAQINLHQLSPTDCDSNLVKQVWSNLILNAVKYSQKKDKPVIDIGSTIDDGHVVYYVKDNGAGFDMQQAGRLFSAFQRLHKSSEFEGTGVGLALVQKIVSRHGGKIWADAKVNEGATFYFTLS